MLTLGADTETLHVYSTLLARFLSILAGTGCIYLCYRLGKNVLSRNAGLVAAATCCVTLRHVFNSGYSTNDVMTSFVLAILMLQLFKLYGETSPTRRDYILAGVTFGILIGTKYTGGAALVLVGILYVWSILRERRQGDRRSLIRRIGKVTGNFFIMGGATVVAFVATTPGLVIQFDYFIASLNRSRTSQAYLASQAELTVLLQEIADVYTEAFGYLIAAFLTLAIVVVPLQSKIQGKQKYFLVSGIIFAVAYTAFLSRSLIPRYLVLLTPVAAILVAAAWHTMHSSSLKWLRISANTLIIATVSISFLASAAGVYSKLSDTRTVAAHFIADNVPLGTEVGVTYETEEHRNTHPWRHPVIDFKHRYVKRDMLEYPKYLVVSSNDTASIAEALESPSLSSEFTWDSDDSAGWYQGAIPDSSIFRFYDELFSGSGPYRLVEKFSQDHEIPVSFPAPTISIYTLDESTR